MEKKKKEEILKLQKMQKYRKRYLSAIGYYYLAFKILRLSIVVYPYYVISDVQKSVKRITKDEKSLHYNGYMWYRKICPISKIKE